MGHYLSEMENPEPIYNLKDVCYNCGYWTKIKKDGCYKCYTDRCPAKIRDDKGDPIIVPSKRERLLKEIAMLEKLIKKLKKQL